MAKRHLKVQGDLGRVIFSVSSMLQNDGYVLSDIGIRPAQYPVYRGKRPAFGCCVQPDRAQISNKVCLSSAREQHENNKTDSSGTFRTKMSTSTVLSVSPRPWPSTMSTASSTFRLTTRTRTLRPNSSGQRYAYASHGWDHLTSTGSGRRSRAIDIP